jgi:hypothetical protein
VQRTLIIAAIALATLWQTQSAVDAQGLSMSGWVTGAQQPVAGSAVTLWVATGQGDPVRVGQATTAANGSFRLRANATPTAPIVYYIVAAGGSSMGHANPAIKLISVLGARPPSHVVVNELTTVASVWTNAQFLNGTNLKGTPLGLRIAAGNVPNFVDLDTGGYGGPIQDALNGPQTPTLANFATLANVLAGCVAQVQSDACSSLFAAATGPAGSAPTDTLGAAETVARYNWYQPQRLFALLDKFYPIPQGKNLRPTPFIPYLGWAPSAWVLPLKFDGGGARAGGKMGTDADGNIWVGDNFTVGSQAQDVLWEGNLSEFAPDGRPLSPQTFGYTGGGVEGVGFGLTIDSHGNVWVSSYGGHDIAVFDKRGKPLTPPGGITFGGQLGLMQGLAVASNGDVWGLGIQKNQLVYFPKGDWNNGRIVCQGRDTPPCSSFVGPFHLIVDPQNNVWVGSAGSNAVTRFPASDPSKAQTIKVDGTSISGMNLDSQGNVWVTTRFANTPAGNAAFQKVAETMKSGGNYDQVITSELAEQSGGGGSVEVFRPDGTPLEAAFSGASLTGPWAIAVDGNDQIWVSNFGRPTGGPIAHLCGVRTETCPPGMKTGDAISPSGGYVGGGMQQLIDIQIDPAGDIWTDNNWQNDQQCFPPPSSFEEWSTLCGGQGVVVFYGMAKPIRTPQIGLPQAP